MMPVHPNHDPKRVFVDANAVIYYIREYTLNQLNLLPTGKKVDKLRKNLKKIRHVHIANTAIAEAEKNLAKDINQKLGYFDARNVIARAELNLQQYCSAAQHDDSLDYVSAARAMYARISDNPNNQKFSKWKKKKSMFVVDPVLGSDRNDLIMLSTAADVARRYEVELWTHDMAFTMFAGEILSTFGVKVVDTYRL